MTLLANPRSKSLLLIVGCSCEASVEWLITDVESALPGQVWAKREAPAQRVSCSRQGQHPILSEVRLRSHPGGSEQVA